MQHASWILDLVIRDAEIKEEYSNIEKPIWFVVSANGLNQPFSTPQVTPTKSPKWNYPARLVLKFSDITTAYLYVTLCTFGNDNNVIIPLARARVGLRTFPIQNPRQFTFPLMNVNDLSQEFSTLRLIATISSFTPQYVTPPPYHTIQTTGGFPPPSSPFPKTNYYSNR